MVGDKMDMDVPPAITHTDPRSAIQTNNSFKSNCDPDEGFNTKAARFTPGPASLSQQQYCDPPSFVVMPEQIRVAQTQIHAALESSMPRTSPFAKKDAGSPTNRCSLPTTIEVHRIIEPEVVSSALIL